MLVIPGTPWVAQPLEHQLLWLGCRTAGQMPAAAQRVAAAECACASLVLYRYCKGWDHGVNDVGVCPYGEGWGHVVNHVGVCLQIMDAVKERARTGHPVSKKEFSTIVQQVRLGAGRTGCEGRCGRAGRGNNSCGSGAPLPKCASPSPCPGCARQGLVQASILPRHPAAQPTCCERGCSFSRPGCARQAHVQRRGCPALPRV